ncbi:MAG: fibronectin type III domain-containing protein, partial [Acidobacteriota bacterium]|nr:fibronectin type III domain-containing protein [Acidobacteriota bacterium]
SATVYAGGAFTSLGSAARSGAGAIGAADGLATAWNPSPNAPVRALLRNGSQIYAGGAFTEIGGRVRQHLALLDTGNGAAAAAFDAPADDVVNALALGGVPAAPLVFAGGEFTNIGGRIRLHLASLDAATGAVTDWHPAFNDTVRTIATAPLPGAPSGPGTLVAVGGEFDAFGAVARRNLAAVNLETGEVLPWRPAPDGAVRAIHARAGIIYIGGDFTRIEQQTRHHLAAFSLSSRQLASWNPDADGPVHALATLVSPASTDDEPMTTTGTVTVFAGGDFMMVGGMSRAKIAAISAATGTPTAWAPAGGDGRVLTIRPTPEFVYAGGQFQTLGGVASPFLGRLNTSTGEADATWNPAPNAEVRALAVDRTSVFAGGVFDTLGGTTRHNIGAVDTTTGSATDWQPQTDGAVNALAREGATLYAGGTFSNVSVHRRPRLVGLDTTVSGPDADYVTSFAPRWLGQILALDARGDGIVAAGDPLLAGNEDEPVSRVAFFPRLLHAPPSRPTGLGASVLGSDVTLRWSPPALGARPEAYLLDAGVTPGGTEVASGVQVSGFAQRFVNVPPGTYYLRLRAANGRGTSPATGDVQVVVGAASCGAPLDPPSDLVASVTGQQVTLSWTPASGAAVTAYRVEAGTQPGAATLRVAVAGGRSGYTAAAPPGAYVVRVRALGPCGDSQPSNEVLVLVGGVGAAPTPPTNLDASITGNAVTLTWDPSAGAAGYIVEAGSAAGASNLAAVAVPATTFTAMGVPSGVYFLRVRAGGADGLSSPSDELILFVP